VLKTQADRTLGRLAREATLAERVTAHLASHGPRAMPTMSEVAQELGMSARSLRRRLMAEGAVYKDLVDQILMREAKRMLESPQVSIQETAYAIGFGTPASFHRAFKRWTGMTPKEYRASY
jgi:AraC-like DNA-binding protein